MRQCLGCSAFLVSLALAAAVTSIPEGTVAYVIPQVCFMHTPLCDVVHVSCSITSCDRVVCDLSLVHHLVSFMVPYADMQAMYFGDTLAQQKLTLSDCRHGRHHHCEAAQHRGARLSRRVPWTS